MNTFLQSISNIYIYIPITISVIVLLILFIWYARIIFLKRTVREGMIKGKCIDKYTSNSGSVAGTVNDGNGFIGGGTWTNYFITLEFKNGVRKTYRCKDELFGQVAVGEQIKADYKLLGNGERWLEQIWIRKEQNG